MNLIINNYLYDVSITIKSSLPPFPESTKRMIKIGPLNDKNTHTLSTTVMNSRICNLLIYSNHFEYRFNIQTSEEKNAHTVTPTHTYHISYPWIHFHLLIFFCPCWFEMKIVWGYSSRLEGSALFLLDGIALNREAFACFC